MPWGDGSNFSLPRAHLSRLKPVVPPATFHRPARASTDAPTGRTICSRVHSLMSRVNWPLCICLTLALAGLIAAERRLAAAPQLRDQRFMPSPVTGYLFRPGRMQSEDIAPDGTPGRDVQPRAGRGDGLRVLVVGDSVAAGRSLPSADRFPARLEASLRRVCGLPTVVVNGGVDGYELTNMRLMLEQVSPRIDPDVVVVETSLFTNLCQRRLPEMDDPGLQMRALAERSHVVQALMLAARGAEGFSSWPSEISFDAAPTLASAAIANIESFRLYARERGARVLLVALPRDLDERRTAVLDGVRRYSARHDSCAIIIEEHPRWRAAQPGCLDASYHLTAAGHATVAEILAREMQARQWVSRAQ